MGRFSAFKHRVSYAGCALHQGEQANGGEHESDSTPGGGLREDVGRSTWTEGSLRTLSTKSACQVRAFALLQQDYADKEDAEQNMNNGEQDCHADSFISIQRFGAEGGT